MSKPWAILRTILFLILLGATACSGSISCSSCGGTPLDPIPGGFDPAAQIERAAQVRLTETGLDFLETEFQNLMMAYMRMACGGQDDVPCPAGFVTVPGNQPNPATCDTIHGECVESVSTQPGPLVGFEIDRSENSGAIVCRDELTNPNRRECYAWLRLEQLALAPLSPDSLQAIITAQIVTTDIPFRYDTLGMDCVVNVDGSLDGNPLQDITVDAEIASWTPPSGTGGRQLQVNLTSVDIAIPDDDVHIERDPDPSSGSNALDSVLCGLANLGPVKNALFPILTGQLQDVIGDEVDKALGMRCGTNYPPCPAQTSCNTKNYCVEDVGGRVVPTVLGLEGRMDLSSLLAGLTQGRPGRGDISFLLGGSSSADSTGLTAGALGGAEVVNSDPTCATILDSPRLRPGFAPPTVLPAVDTVDLDFDGTAETPYMVAAGLSQALVDQFIWTIYTTGMLCARISAQEVDLLNTGSLGLVIPSLSQLTHSDRFRWAIYPAALTLYPSAEPSVTIGQGKVTGSSAAPVIEEPLLTFLMDDLEVNFYGVVEERWIRLMTVRLDLTLEFGAIITPNNEIELVIGDLEDAVTDVHVTNSEILAEDPADLADAIPGLLSIGLPEMGIPPFALPSAAELGGFELNVLGIRGIEDSPNVYGNVGIYADLGFDPTQAPNLMVAAETQAEIREIRMPSVQEISVTNPGGPVTPEVLLALSGQAPAGKRLEYQIRLGEGLWSPFFSSDELVLRRPEFLVQGRYQLSVRSRIVGEYRTLDPTPVLLDVVIDPEPPRLITRLSPINGGVFVFAHDVVSGDNLIYEVAVDGAWRVEAPAEDSFIQVPEVLDMNAEVHVAVTDEVGLRTERLVKIGGRVAEEQIESTADEKPSGCVCVSTPLSRYSLLFLPLRR